MTTPCTYTHFVEQDVHKFMFHRANNTAVDLYMERFESLLAQVERGERQHIYLLFDITPQGMFPIDYAYQRTQALFQQYTVTLTSKVAYLCTPEDAQRLRDEIARRYAGGNVSPNRQFFTPAEEAKALAWLTAAD